MVYAPIKKKSYIIIYNGGYVLLCDLRHLSSYNRYAREKKPMVLKRTVFFFIQLPCYVGARWWIVVSDLAVYIDPVLDGCVS